MNGGHERSRLARCGTSRRPSSHAGVTLLELLVVLMILGLMAGIAIPTFSRLGLFSRNDVQQTARELYSLMRAAKIYAATYRVDTAVAFQYGDAKELGGSADCLRAVALLYRHPHPADMGRSEKPNGVYVPIRDNEGGFRMLPGDTGVLLHDPFSAAPYTHLPPGMSGINVYWPSSGDYEDAHPCLEPCVDSNGVPGGTLCPVYAWIFSPSGRIYVRDHADSQRCPDDASADMELWRMYVGIALTGEPAERLTDANNPSSQERVIAIDLYRGTGRAVIVRD